MMLLEEFGPPEKQPSLGTQTTAKEGGKDMSDFSLLLTSQLLPLLLLCGTQQKLAGWTVLVIQCLGISLPGMDLGGGDTLRMTSTNVKRRCYPIPGRGRSKEGFPVEVTLELRTEERKRLACEERREEQVLGIHYWRSYGRSQDLYIMCIIWTSAPSSTHRMDYG